MERLLDIISGSAEVIIFIAFGVLIALAVIRSLIKVKRGEKIDITPVGVYNDLPSSVTGLNKHKEHKQ